MHPPEEARGRAPRRETHYFQSRALIEPQPSETSERKHHVRTSCKCAQGMHHHHRHHHDNDASRDIAEPRTSPPPTPSEPIKRGEGSLPVRLATGRELGKRRGAKGTSNSFRPPSPPPPHPSARAVVVVIDVVTPKRLCPRDGLLVLFRKLTLFSFFFFFCSNRARRRRRTP